MRTRNDKYNRISRISLLPALLLLLLACDKEQALCDPDEDGKVELIFSTAVVDADAYTRAGETPPANETIHDLRVLVVRPDGTVEHNKAFTASTQAGQIRFGEIKLDVEPFETKTVYLFANTEGFGDTFYNIKALKPGDNTKEDELASKVFTWTEGVHIGTTPIPMSAMYKIDIYGETIDRTEDDPLYVVRTATRYTFWFKNEIKAQRELRIKSWKIDKIIAENGRSFILPNVSGEEQFEGYGTDWIKAMAAEANNIESNDDKIWILDYKIPDGQTHSPLSFDRTSNTDGGIPLPYGETFSTEAESRAYFPESRFYGMTPIIGDGDDETDEEEEAKQPEDKVQSYIFTVDIEEKDNQEKWVKKTYSAPLPNLKSLFRNTHVKVEVVFKGDAIPPNIFAGIEPWIVLKPINGDLGPDDPGNWKDPDELKEPATSSSSINN